jgi:hypothetical protein
MSTLKADTLVAADGTSPVTLTKQSAAKMWAQFNGSTNVIGGSLNASSLTDHGTGDFTLAVVNAFNANDEFAATYGGNCRSGAAINYAYGYDFGRLPTASNMRWAMENSSGTAFDNSTYGNHISVSGDLA